MKAIRFFLLVLIIIGLGLIVTQSLWVPTVVNTILQYQGDTSQTSATYEWISLPDAEKQGLICTNDTNSLTYCNTLLSQVDASTFVIAFYVGTPRPPVALLVNFAKDKNHVYFLFYNRLEVVSGADVLSFMPLQFTGLDGYAKDKNGAYWDSFSIPNVDLATFTVVGNGYAKDKNHVYAGELYQSDPDLGFVVKGADPATFVSVSNKNGYDAQDKNNKYFEGSVIQPTTKTSVTASQTTQEPYHWVLLNSTSTLPYIVKGGSIYYHDTTPPGDYLIPNADPATFAVAVGLITPTPYTYTEDKNQVYDFETPFPSADPNTFTPMFTPEGNFSNYSKDKINVYFSYVDGPDDTVLPMIVSSDIKDFYVLSGQQSCGTNCTYDAYDNSHKYDWGKVVQ